MRPTPEDLGEIERHLDRIEYGELRIVIRGGEIVSFSTIISSLKHSVDKPDKVW